MKSKIWKVGSLNIQAGLSTNCYSDYLTNCWHHVSPTAQNKHNNLFAVGEKVSHLDVFGVQEVDPGSMRSGFTNQAEHLAKHGKFDHFAYQSNRLTGLSTTANALFSKTSMKETCNIRLPSRKKAQSPRGLLASHVETKHGPLCVAVAHLSLHPLDRKRQAEEIALLLAQEERLILMGDFNDTPSSMSLKNLQECMEGHTTLPTYPRWQPARAIDTIWWRGVDVLEERTHEWGATDHRGVEIDFLVPKST